MILARIVGTVVATRKDARLVSNKLLLARAIDPRDQSRFDGGYVATMSLHGQTSFSSDCMRHVNRSDGCRIFGPSDPSRQFWQKYGTTTRYGCSWITTGRLFLLPGRPNSPCQIANFLFYSNDSPPAGESRWTL